MTAHSLATLGGSLIQASSLAERPRKNHLFGAPARVHLEPCIPPVPDFRSILPDEDDRPGIGFEHFGSVFDGEPRTSVWQAAEGQWTEW